MGQQPFSLRRDFPSPGRVCSALAAEATPGALVPNGWFLVVRRESLVSKVNAEVTVRKTTQIEGILLITKEARPQPALPAAARPPRGRMAPARRPREHARTAGTRERPAAGLCDRQARRPCDARRGGAVLFFLEARLVRPAFCGKNDIIDATHHRCRSTCGARPDQGGIMDDRVYELLNDQINKELYSAYLYLSFADYYDEEGLSGFRELVRDPGAGGARPCPHLPQLPARQRLQGEASGHRPARQDLHDLPRAARGGARAREVRVRRSSTTSTTQPTRRRTIAP